MRSNNPACPNFLDSNLPEFSSFHNAMDDVLQKLRMEGVQAESKSTEAFSKEEIDCLWVSGALLIRTPKGLLRAVLFLNGITFCLQEGKNTVF